MLRFGLMLAVSLLTSLPAGAVVVRVGKTPGGPQICVDGRPVPPRFFWGAMNSGRCSVSGEWTTQSFDFIPGKVDGTGTLHFRFGQAPGEIWLADVRIQDAQTKEDILNPGSFASDNVFQATWSTWPPREANTVGKVGIEDGLTHVTLTNPPNGVWPDWHLHSYQGLRFAEGRTYRCSFRAKATPRRDLSVAVYNVTGGVWNFVVGPPGRS